MACVVDYYFVHRLARSCSDLCSSERKRVAHLVTEFWLGFRAPLSLVPHKNLLPSYDKWSEYEEHRGVCARSSVNWVRFQYLRCNCMRERHVSIRNQLRERVRSRFVRSSSLASFLSTPLRSRERAMEKADYFTWSFEREFISRDGSSDLFQLTRISNATWKQNVRNRTTGEEEEGSCWASRLTYPNLGGNARIRFCYARDNFKISQLKRSLEEKLQTLTKCDEEILSLVPEGDIEEEIVRADEIKERLYNALSLLESSSQTASSPTNAGPVAIEPSTTTDSPDVDPGSPRGAKVRLPKMPRFISDPLKWTTFCDSSIHLNPDISKVDKFNYLRSLLDHIALDSIDALTLSSANYQQAIDIISKRFGNKQLIISKHMDTLLNIDAISSDRNFNDLRRLYDHTESHARPQFEVFGD